MRDVWMVGAATAGFGKRPGTGAAELAQEIGRAHV